MSANKREHSGDFSIGSDVWPGVSKLIEECGEVTQVCGKLLGSRGVVEHWDGTNLRDRLTEELGDLLAALRFVVKHADLDGDAMFARSEKKFATFEKWHAEQAIEVKS